MSAPRIMIAAGEASGDARGAALVRAVKARRPEVEFYGLGGEAMAAAGAQILVPAEDLAVVGFTAVVPKLRFFRRVLKDITRRLHEEKPDLLILIDYPDFNLRLAKAGRRAGVPVFYYIAPQLWAWRPGRVKHFRRFVDRLAVLFPFEPAWFAARGVRVDFVGHPLYDEVPELSREEARGRLGLRSKGRLVGLLPGSRWSEVGRILPEFLGAARILHQRDPDVEFLLPVAPTVNTGWIDDQAAATGLPVRMFRGQTHVVMAAVDVALTASGTATVELALSGTPMVVVYKGSRINELIARLLVRGVDHAAMVNLIAGREIVPELLQHAARDRFIARRALNILENPDLYARIRRDLAEVRRRLGPGGATDRAADIVLNFLESPTEVG
ncbi:MAG: lipid-A-disaccharide synthase [Proteobacteria bacterium]|nr:lipid-A-disaccharide synthase [Pseudomonadota bacterium]